jgi:hypothetical protein
MYLQTIAFIVLCPSAGTSASRLMLRFYCSNHLTIQFSCQYSILTKFPISLTLFSMLASAHPTRKPASAKAQARIGVLRASRKDPVELTWEQQKVADQWYWKFCQRWGNDLPQWRANILKGVARRLAKNPVPAGWGLSTLRARSGHGLARKCRAEGIEHSIHAARRMRTWKRAGRPLTSSRQLPV